MQKGILALGEPSRAASYTLKGGLEAQQLWWLCIVTGYLLAHGAWPPDSEYCFALWPLPLLELDGHFGCLHFVLFLRI